MRFIYTKTFAKIFTIFVILAFFIILDATGYITFFKNWFLEGFGFIETRVSNLSNDVKSGLSTIFTIKRLAHDNALLNQTVDQLSFEF